MNTTVKAHEGAKRAGFTKSYSLGVTAVINDEFSVESEIRHINEALINWLKRRKKSAAELAIIYTANPELTAEIVESTEKLIRQDFEWKPYVQNLRDVKLVIIDPATGTPREFSLKK